MSFDAIVAVLGIVVGAGISLVAVWLTNRHSERMAASARWWERCFDAYTEAVGVAEEALDASHELEYDGYPALTEEARRRLYDQLSQARAKLSILHPKSYMVLSEKSTEALSSLIAALILYDEPTSDNFGAIGAAAKACRDTLISEANESLGRPEANTAIARASAARKAAMRQ